MCSTSLELAGKAARASGLWKASLTRWSGTKGCQKGSAAGNADGTLRLLTGAGRFLERPRRLGSLETGSGMGDGSNGCLASGCGADAVPQ